MANIDLGNLTRYDGKIKQYTEDKYLSRNTANWQMTEKAGAVTCYPVPDTELEPIVDFSFKEVPPASGEKSTSNPSTIEGVNSIILTRCGKNLIIPRSGLESLTINDVTFTVNSDNTYTVNGTASADAIFYIRYSNNNGIHLKNNIYYTFSGCPSGGSSTTYCLSTRGNVSNIQHIDIGNNITFKKADIKDINNACIVIKKNTTVSNLIFKPQLELNSTATFFEPYTGNEYIYQLDNTYYGGSVNLATGEMTVTHNISRVGDYQNTVEFNDEYNCWRVFITPKADYTVLPICTHSIFKLGTDFLNAIDSTFRWTAGGLGQWFMFKSPVTTAEEFLAVYENAYIIFKLLNPYTVQLDPVQIKSLTALDKNTPRLNTLYTDADSIQVGYQKHPARTAYELENAILALGGGE